MSTLFTKKTERILFFQMGGVLSSKKTLDFLAKKRLVVET